VKKPTYEEFGDTLSPESAMLQAAAALDLAAYLAIKQDNAEQLTSIAACWMELGSRLLRPDGDHEGHNHGDEPEESGHPIGFGLPHDLPNLEVAQDGGIDGEQGCSTPS
jgi:hypothetical protein